MQLLSILERWKKDPSIGPNITSWMTIPPRQPQWTTLPSDLDPQLISFLKTQGVDHLYNHQAQCWQMAQDGKNVVLSTGTASGKSLAYQLPVLNEILKGNPSTALMLFPTKALARDQLGWINNLPDISAFAYDGDTPQSHRKSIRDKADIIITNPDMLHLGILPYHTHWDKFLSRLKYVILDEIHIYRGVFGSHISNLLRRLKRITAHYGASPQFILASATIGNPLQLGEALIEDDMVLIDEDCSSRGEKHFLIFNPPIISDQIGLRASMQGEIIKFADELTSSGLQTIIFGRSRRTVEFMLSRLKERSSLDPESLQAYRSGYLPDQRRNLEAGLRSGEIRCITATTALELGVDIGGLDASLLAGYPGTIAGAWQQAGRSGRGENPSLSILVLSPTPLDQYIATNPEFLFSSSPEYALINPDNLLILLSHIKCAAYELPFEIGDSFGLFGANQTSEMLAALENLGCVHRSEKHFFWMADSYPSSEVSLRTTSPNRIALQLVNEYNQTALLGTIDYESAIWMVHPGAVYLHQGNAFHVDNLDLDHHTASLSPFQGEYYTEPVKNVEIDSLRVLGEEPIQGGSKYYGEIQITSSVNGFKRIDWNNYGVLGLEPLDLPSTVLSSLGFWISLSEDMETILRSSGIWNSSQNDYGSSWNSIRNQVLSRDQFTCLACGKTLPPQSLHVHHKIPLRSFSSLKDANQLSNLVSLCPRCHVRAESVVRVKSGISGLGYLLHNLSPLILMCDPGDLGYHTDFASPLGFGRPTILLYEHIPAGIGFSQYLYENIVKLLTKAYDVITECPCEDGCPGCVGPGGELGSGGKKETEAILNLLY